MAENKTVPTDQPIEDFLATVEDETVRADCFALALLMAEATGEKPVMWGNAIIGFGSYHYKYESGRQGDICLSGFSPRVGKIALYVLAPFKEKDELLAQLGKYKTGGGCLYIKKLSDIDTDVLTKLVKGTMAFLKNKYQD